MALLECVADQIGPRPRQCRLTARSPPARRPPPGPERSGQGERLSAVMPGCRRGPREQQSADHHHGAAAPLAQSAHSVSSREAWGHRHGGQRAASIVPTYPLAEHRPPAQLPDRRQIKQVLAFEQAAWRPTASGCAPHRAGARNLGGRQSRAGGSAPRGANAARVKAAMAAGADDRVRSTVRARITVADDGPGIPPSTYPYLQSLFTTSSLAKGGPRAVRIPQHRGEHGRLWAENRPEEGDVSPSTCPSASPSPLARHRLPHASVVRASSAPSTRTVFRG